MPAEAIDLMDEDGVDAASDPSSGLGPGSTEMAFKPARDDPGPFAILGSLPLDRLSVWRGPIRGWADRVDLVQFHPLEILLSKALRFTGRMVSRGRRREIVSNSGVPRSHYTGSSGRGLSRLPSVECANAGLGASSAG
jgi:hypothetical protein